MKKAIRRKIVISIVTIVMLITVFTTSTYAWLVTTKQVSVNNFQFNAHGGEGFLVSVDGENFHNDLTTEQMMMAIVKGYDRNRYEIENNTLYDTSGERRELYYDDMEDILSNDILLYPVTTTDGVSFTNLVNNTIDASSGQFLEFDIYFKATSADASDQFTYDIYICGEDIIQENGKTIDKTTIESQEVDVIPLMDNMILYDGTEEGLLAGPNEDKKTVDVYTSNAIRYSVVDTTNETPAIIYEPTNEHDLGSYATDYSGNDAELNKLYNAKYNAMYTYYNNIRENAQLGNKLLSYEDKPDTVRELTEDTIITRVSAGSGINKLTFRFWLEGWDADCFDGLSKSINVKLLFNSKRVYNN